MTNSLACFKTGFSLSQDYINGDVRFEHFSLIQLHLIPWNIKPCCSSSQDQVMPKMSLVFINKRNCKVIQSVRFRRLLLSLYDSNILLIWLSFHTYSYVPFYQDSSLFCGLSFHGIILF